MKDVFNHQDTIAAIATASGGGVGVVRVSGQDLSQWAGYLSNKVLKPRQATFGAIYDAQNKVLDYALLIYFPAPHSFTGEDVLEIQCHGGRVILQMILKRTLALGARLANPGEFTRRAFLNGKISLDEAEAIVDLIHAATERAAQSAVRSLSQIFQKKIAQTVEKLTQCRVLLETSLDFAEEDIDWAQLSNVHEKIQSAKEDLASLKKEVQTGILLQSGIRVVLVGAPNVGKSSLLNALSGEDIALVSNIAGTTRDALNSSLQIGGFPLHLMDTAGLRDDSEDPLEQMGMHKTWQAIQKADVVLLIGDAREGKTKTLQELAQKMPPQVRVLFLMNKMDLLPQKPPIPDSEESTLWMSAKTGEGLTDLKNALLKQMGVEADCQDVFIARERHLRAIDAALAHLKAASHLNESDLIAEELRLAQHSLFEITGQVSTEDLLERIFSQFCIGK